jgi:hypothetical protein
MRKTSTLRGIAACTTQIILDGTNTPGLAPVMAAARCHRGEAPFCDTPLLAAGSVHLSKICEETDTSLPVARDRRVQTFFKRLNARNLTVLVEAISWLATRGHIYRRKTKENLKTSVDF